jgi:hypothetical protein
MFPEKNMKYFIPYGQACAVLCSALLGSIGTATAAPETVTETRAIDPRVVRVKLDGVVNIRIRQGATPVLVLTGEPRLLAKTTALHSGDTLTIDTEAHGVSVNLGRHRGVHAELTLPALREVSSESVGGTTISGFSGDMLALNLDGAGSMHASCDYRVVRARLGGVGSMKLHGIDSDSVALNLSGAGYMTLSGRSHELKAELGGLGGLDAHGLRAENLDLELSGLGNATVTATQRAHLELSGVGSVTVHGKPANRKVRLDGLGKVNWK